MVKNVKEAIAEKSGIVEQVEEQTTHKSKAAWLIIPAAVLTIGMSTFFVIRRFAKKDAE